MQRNVIVLTILSAFLAGCTLSASLAESPVGAAPTATVLAAQPPALTNLPTIDFPGTLTAVPVTGPCQVLVISSGALVWADPLAPDAVLGSAVQGAIYPMIARFPADYGVTWFQIDYAGQPGWIPSMYGDGGVLVAVTQGDCSIAPFIYPAPTFQPSPSPTLTPVGWIAPTVAFDPYGTPTSPPTATFTPSPTATSTPASPLLTAVPAGAVARLGEGDIMSLAVSPDGQLLAAAGTVFGVPGIHVYRLDTYEQVLFTPGYAYRIAFGPAGGVLASVDFGSDTSVSRWDLSTGDLLPPFESRLENLLSVAISPNGQRMAASGQPGASAAVWNGETGELLHVLRWSEPDMAAAVDIGFSADGMLLAMGGVGRNAVALWNVDTGELVSTLEGPSLTVNPSDPYGASRMRGYVNRVAFSPDGRYLAATIALDQGHVVGVWTLGNRAASPILLIGDSEARGDLSFNPAGTLLAVGLEDGSIALWDATTWSQRYLLEGHQDAVESLVFSPDGRILISGAETILVWEVPSA